MFYKGIPLMGVLEGGSRAVVVLNPPESKRLIGKAVASLPEVQHAFHTGRLIVCEGSTNAFVVEELLSVSFDKETYPCGVVSDGWLSAVPKEARTMPYLFRLGESLKGCESAGCQDGPYVDALLKPNWQLHAELIQEFEPDDVLVKGASAVDTSGDAGVLVAEGDGGSIGRDLPIVISRGSHLIVPVGLEKLVPSVRQAVASCGLERFAQAHGFSVGMLPLVNGKIVTEVQALSLLAGVSTVQLAAGGIGGSEGAVVLGFSGSREEVSHAFQIVQALKGEPALRPPEVIAEVAPEMRHVRYTQKAVTTRGQRDNYRTHQ